MEDKDQFYTGDEITLTVGPTDIEVRMTAAIAAGYAWSGMPTAYRDEGIVHTARAIERYIREG